MKVQLLLAWGATWRSLPDWQDCLADLWKETYTAQADRPASQRWRHVATQLDAVITTILEVGWRPRAADLWQDGDTLHHVGYGAGFHSFVCDVFGAACEQQVWQKASQFRLGTGPPGPKQRVNWDLTLRVARRLAATAPAQRGALEVVMQGAFWFQQRRLEAGYTDTAKCPFCPCETECESHAFYECPKSRELVGAAWDDTVVEQGRRLFSSDPALWGRGLVSEETWRQALGQGFVAQPRLRIFAGGLLQRKARHALGPGRWLAGADGSGGAQGRDAVLRRVGWGFAVATPSLRPVLWANGTAPGVHQTVPHAEAMARFQLLDHTRGSEGHITIFVDASAVIRRFRRPRLDANGAHRQLWQDIREATLDRKGGVRLVKEK